MGTEVKTAVSLQCITEIPPGRSAHLLVCTPVVYIIAFSLFTMNDRLVKGILIVEHNLHNFLSKQDCILCIFTKVLQVAYPSLIPTLALTHYGPCLPSSSEDHDSH